MRISDWSSDVCSSDLIVLAGGSNAREAALVAENLVLANLSGHDSHGVGMLPQYILAVVEKRLKINAAPSVIADHGAILNLDGNMGYDQVIEIGRAHV